MDLSTFELSDKPVQLDILHPVSGAVVKSEDGKTLAFFLVGRDSKQHQDAERENSNKRLKRLQATNGKKAITHDELKEDELSSTIACVAGWQNVGLEGKELEFSKDNVRTVFNRFPFIREQVEQFIADRANFLKP